MYPRSQGKRLAAWRNAVQAVSLLVARSTLYSPAQKLGQCLIVWLFPVLGPAGIWAFLRSQRRWERYDTRAYPEHSEEMTEIDPDDAGQVGSGDGGAGSGSD